MCNHYRQGVLKGVEIPGWTPDIFSETRIQLRLETLGRDVFPDREAPVVVMDGGTPHAEVMRWGFPPVKGPVVTNIRNTASPYWRGWLKPEFRCVVPATSFAEYGQETPKREHWFERSDGATIWFAGIWRPWTGVRGPKSKPVEAEHRLFAFLTCEPNAVVAPIHPKAMPVILEPTEVATWLTAPIEIAGELQRPLPGKLLRLTN